VLADDESLFRASLRQLLSVPALTIKDVYGVEVPGEFEVVGEAATGEDTVQLVRAVHPDLLLLDLVMPRMSGLEALRELGPSPAVPTILLSGLIDRTHLLSAVRLGVRGLILKHTATEQLFEAMSRVVAGGYWLEQSLMSELLTAVRPLIESGHAARSQGVALTPRERQVLTLVAAGYANKEIARTCDVSEETIKHHLTRMFDKVGASNRVELTTKAAQLGLHLGL
jgi:DNA-binding NarL/FixJ family response regulator